MSDSAWTAIDGVRHQKVRINHIDPGVLPDPSDPNAKPFTGYYQAAQSNADVAEIVLNNPLLASGVQRVAVEPDVVSHEFAHALVDDLRRNSGFGRIAAPREAGATKEGLSDLFAIAFNHKMLAAGPPWQCFLAQAASGPGSLECLEDISNPRLSVLNRTKGGQPNLYLDVAHGYQAPTTSCDASNDRCGVHVNSTIVSHWGYLLAAGSATVTDVPCGLNVAPR